MSNRDEELRAAAPIEENGSSPGSSSSASTETTNFQGHGALVRREDTEERDEGDPISLCDSEHDAPGDQSLDEHHLERVLHAWFNVPLRLGEIKGPEGTIIVKGQMVFLNCLLAYISYVSYGLDVSELIQDVAQDVRDEVAQASHQPGMTVEVVWDLDAETGKLHHPRGTVSLDAQGDLHEMVTDWVVEPSVRTRCMKVDGQLPFDWGDLRKTAVRAARNDWHGPRDDQKVVSFLETMDIYPAEVQPDVEATEFIWSEQTLNLVASKKVTVHRDDEGRFRGVALVDANDRRKSFNTPNQDVTSSMWAQVEPFSVAGARVVMESLLLSSFWGGERPVVIEIAPTWEPLPPDVKMEKTPVINPSKEEDVRTAFHFVQEVAWAKAAQRGPAEPPEAPCVTIVVTGQDP